jgi:hypothetical protein
LVVDTVPQPSARTGEVLIRLQAAALNHRDVWIKTGQYAGLHFPIIPGSDGAGTVTEVGPGVDESWLEREVIINPSFDWGHSEKAQEPRFTILGLPHDGTLAQYIRVPVVQVAPKPTHLASMAEAITLTERRSQQAEWAARDQLIAGFFQNAVGTTLPATITGVTPFGCFVQATLPSGAMAEGLLPKWHLPDHHYVGSQQAFRQQRPPKPTRPSTSTQSASQSSGSASGPKAMQWLRVGTRLMVQLAVADPLAGRLTFALPST